MREQSSELPEDLTDIPFRIITDNLLSNGGEIRRKINGVHGVLSVLEVNGTLYYKHPGLPRPTHQIVLRSDSIGQVTPRTFIP